MEGYNTKLAIEAQREFCKEHAVPHFAPGFDGSCFSCNQNIYAPIAHSSGNVTGYTVDYARQHHITFCPHCHRSFDD